MSGRRAIIHVGAPRTGTTTLQTLLDRHRSALLEVGVLYPDLVPVAADHRHLNHQHLGETLDGRRPRAERRELLGGLDAALRRTSADVVILSYERLCLVPRWRRVPALLAELFARRGFALEILCTVRPPAGAAQSHYAWRCQFLREASSLGEAFAADLRNPCLDPALFRPWIAAAGGRVAAVPLQDLRSSEPLAVRALAALGLDDRVGTLLTADDLSQSENRSLDAMTLEASRRLRADGVRLRDNGTARRVVDAIAEEVGRRGLGGERFEGLDAGMVARAEARFADANDRFARRVWGERWVERVAPDRPGPATEIAARPHPLPAETESALNDVAEAVRQRFDLARRRPRLRFGPLRRGIQSGSRSGGTTRSREDAR